MRSWVQNFVSGATHSLNHIYVQLCPRFCLLAHIRKTVMIEVYSVFRELCPSKKLILSLASDIPPYPHPTPPPQKKSGIKNLGIFFLSYSLFFFHIF